MEKKKFYSLLQSVPKAEIHIHSEAVISRATVKKLYKKSSGKAMSDDELKALFSYENLSGFIQSFIKIQSFLTETKDFKLIFKDLENYLVKNNIVWCETFFSPTAFLRKGFDFHQMMETVSGEIERIEKSTGRKIRLLIDVSRTFGEENAMKNLDLILKENNPYIIGIGLGGDEAKGPAKEYKKVFAKARKAGLHVVAHAGEDVDSSSIKDALNLLKAERIGHGITCSTDKALIKKLSENKTPLEICPTSNTFTKKIVNRMEEHPVRFLFDQGVFITINSDDPTFFGVSVNDEYYNLYKKLNFTLDEILQLILNSFDAGFLSDSAKKKYKTAAKKAWKEWMSENKE